MRMCKCMSVRRPLVAALKDVGEELVEFIHEPSCDEASDVAFTLGRLLGSVLGRVYVRFPGDGMCLAKMRRRVKEHGCIRSMNHTRCS